METGAAANLSIAREAGIARVLNDQKWLANGHGLQHWSILSALILEENMISASMWPAFEIPRSSYALHTNLGLWP